MIDLHSHILADIDDGASTLDDSVAMLAEISKQGVSTVLATPHIHIGVFDNTLETIRASFTLLCERLQKEALSITLGFAAEVRLCPEIITLLEQDKLPFLGSIAGKKLLLLEFPHTHIPPGSERFIDFLLAKNILPLIAHPERNVEARELPQVLQPFIQRSCMFQITASSILGQFGKESESLAWQLIASSPNVVVASDMHNMQKRAPRMEEAYRAVSSKFGELRADELFVQLPHRIISSNSSLVSF
ncbi:tyrosine-protein phosphatase [Agaribacterium sp. ZY112]|uniref:tyrosine-protein phosphatase n=1 Tax=Agaribacterium sp. ZY112 TaxID=3233574 RepID=UPI0035267542